MPRGPAWTWARCLWQAPRPRRPEPPGTRRIVMGLLDGKVAIVTGAGGGIGRAEALLLASEGAQIVVNDLGGARDGTGSSESAAGKVVTEIEAAGGKAVASFDDV